MGGSTDEMAGALFHMLRGRNKRMLSAERSHAERAAFERDLADRDRLTRIDDALSPERMCNRYADDVELAILREGYGLSGQVESNDGPMFVHPGYPGRVVTADRWLRRMTWGFPLFIKGKSGQPLKPRPVNNTRTDKVFSGFWSSSFRDRRCLIPLSRFCEAEGEKGRKTETWYRGEGPMLTAAGIWRESVEWGRVYSMMMTDSAPPVSRIHDRMPVLLRPDDYATWLDGAPDVALALCRPTEGLIEDRTDKLWSG
jgi:putative SOS response-associated peptidase YedK